MTRRALGAMALGLGVHVFAYAVQQTRLSIPALLLFLWGALALGGGARWARAAAFPVGFVLLAVPVSFLDTLGFYLRYGVSISAEGIARGAGLEILRQGTQLVSPEGKYHYDVAAACSGVRSLVALFALSVLVGYLAFAPWRARLLLALLTAPFAFVGNLVRILAIVFAGDRWGHAAGARVHDLSGALVFLVVLALLLGATRLFPARWRRSATTVETGIPAVDHRPPVSPFSRTVVATVCLACGLAALATWQLDRRPPAAEAGVRLLPDGEGPAPLPAFLGTEWIGQRVEVTAVERELLPPDTGYSRRNYVSVAERHSQVFFSIVLSGRDRSSIHRPELCIAGQGWTVRERRTTTLNLPEGAPLEVSVLQLEGQLPDGAGRLHPVTTLLAYWFVGPRSTEASYPGILWQNALARLGTLRSPRWAYVLVQSPVVQSPEDSWRAIETVVGEVWPQVRALPEAPR